MTSNLLSIGASGARAAQIALDVTGQNIANASTDGYVRRAANNVELVSPSGWSAPNDISLAGVTVSGITRNADIYTQAEVRRTASDTARGNATVTGLTNVETAVENSGVFTTIGNFQNALTSLKQTPNDTSLRAAVMQAGSAMTSAFQIAATSLSSTQQDLQGEIGDGVSQVNTLASQLATINLKLSTTASAASADAGSLTTSDRASLMDKRDQLLGQISQYANVATTLNSDGSANVNLGGVSGPPLVTGATTNTLSSTTASDGTVSLAMGTAPVTLSGGSIAGQQASLTKLNQISTDLDSLAATIANTVNTQQANGADLSGTTGAALFSGTTAATLSMATTDGSKIAAAAAGSVANSNDATNLTALSSALSTANPAGTMNNILYDISGSVKTATTTRDTLKTLSDAAAASLSSSAGVDLNTEAVNLVRFQQAFQASGKVMQTASDIFTTMLNLK
ncbi:Flagellar hook-associated protein [Novosphingobium nitrogenifigens DSM 19370]|uniref:Flagellar hook-associated protein 1 n=1 Tax=Novosphingobium nitrogenifigens DSM 19370 TaxID=983920 RepID=F1Z7M8_9SPHN|nr:flagellar hook-associated protein FlgK [Novosphingobium nitrogenifigens]EGD59419.1 Flagellar hook-associated protein [Novosphingobium nitrogenifigens DSM 19370]